MSKKINISILSLVLALMLVFGSCTESRPPILSNKPPPPTPMTMTLSVPMTGTHVEEFDLDAGDRVVGKFSIDGQYTVSLSIEHDEYLGKVEGVDGHYIPISDFEFEDTMGESFAFTMPVSAIYTFTFTGCCADEPVKEEFKELSQTVVLHLTIHYR